MITVQINLENSLNFKEKYPHRYNINFPNINQHQSKYHVTKCVYSTYNANNIYSIKSK